MQRLSFFLVLICFAGCNGQSTTAVPAAPQRSNTAELASERVDTAEETVGGILLQPKAVVKNKLALLVPQGFTIMDEEMLSLKYPSERRPTEVYTNKDGSINLAINHTKDRMPQSDISAFHKQMDGMFRNLYPSATWFESGVIGINGREWLTLNLRTPAIDTEIRNIMVGTSVEGRLLLVSFNVTKEQESQWLEPAKAIVQSLRVKD
jgi:hypothetical protein